MKTKGVGILVLLSIVILGCSTHNLPLGARLVRGGLDIAFTAPTDGTAILMERNSGRIVATQSLTQGDTFHFGPNQQGWSETLASMFPPTTSVRSDTVPQLPANTLFQLYFVPVKAKKQ